MMETIIFPSRVDLWLVILVVAVFVLVFAFHYVVPKESKLRTSRKTHVRFLASVVPTAIFCVWLFTTTKYSLFEDRLAIASGPFSWEIDIASIESITESNSTLASPALSLDRLLITYEEGRSILISPLDKELFVENLSQRMISDME